MTSPELSALSPVDGRYAAKLSGLRELCSEAGLIGLRVRVEARWVQHLKQQLGVPTLRDLPGKALEALEKLSTGTRAADAGAVKAIESKINHDVKAVEYFVREKLRAAGASAAALEFVHFGCTSEDINNLCYALMLKQARDVQLLPAMESLIEHLRTWAHTHAATPMLARTHGQTASPTTMGKEIANVVVRLRRQRDSLKEIAILGKFNGAVGNYNAHVAAFPDADWPQISRSFVESLGLTLGFEDSAQPMLKWNAYSTQIDPHDWIAEYCDALARFNTVLIDLSRDIWGYISLGYFKQRAVAGEVGSSTMPHKVNPIDFENAEGNLGIANALLRHFAEKLPISRWQRDLTDSTVLRNLGVALGHCLLALQALSRGLGRLEVNAERLAADLDAAWEVLAEPIQTVMRAAGVPNGYEKLKAFSRGQAIDRQSVHAFIGSLDLPAADKQRLLALTPATYIGLAAKLAREV